jgi:hypothetical protein
MKPGSSALAGMLKNVPMVRIMSSLVVMPDSSWFDGQVPDGIVNISEKVSEGLNRRKQR